MKVLIGSDIHGSAYYCRALLETYKKEGAERLLLLGDLLYHGPRNDLPRDYAPKEVSSLLNAYKADIVCVRGNCEAEVDQMMLDFPVLAEYALLAFRKNVIYATHGHVHNPKQLPPIKAGDILLNGHTHVPACRQVGDIWYLNPGSVSIPKEDSCHSYMIWEEDAFYWKDVETMEVYQEFRWRQEE